MIYNYLSGRSVNLQTHRFYLEKIGTPQGSLLASTLWNIALNSLLESLNKVTLAVAYADDLTVCVSASTKWQLEQTISTLIDQVNTWSRRNNLKINTTKSVILRKTFFSKRETEDLSTLINKIKNKDNC